MRLGHYERALATLAQAHDGRVPVLGQTTINGISSNASLALHRVLAHQQLGLADESSEEILARVQSVVDNFAAEESTRGYRLLGAKVLLLQGDRDAALPMISAAADSLSMAWYDRYDPIFVATLDEELVRELTASIDEHVDGERAQLAGNPPSSDGRGFAQPE